MFGSIGPPELILILLIIAMPLPLIFYLLMLKKTIDRCGPENRTMSSGQVWLLLIPLFALAWHFYIVKNVADSLEREFRKRGLPVEPHPGRDLGYAMSVLNIAVIVPLLGIFAGIAGFICWIMYWIKIAGFSKRLATGG